MSIQSVFDLIVNFFSNIINGLLQFISFCFNLPIFLTNLFTNLPGIFAIGFSIMFTIVIIALYLKVYHMMKG